MSTQTTARGIVGSLRLVGTTAALAAGIAGSGTVGAGSAAAADTVPAQLAAVQGSATSGPPQGKVSRKACDAMSQGRVPASVTVTLGCIVIGGSGPITGGTLF